MRTARLALAFGACLTAAAVTTAPATAHVSIPEPGEQGGFTIVTFSVPNERDDAQTVTIEVQLPQDHPLAFVSTQPKPDWTVETTTRTLDEPIDAFGEQLSEVVDTVVWTGGPIGPGEFDTFSMSVGPLPDDVDELAFPTIQIYDSGEEVAWIEPTPAGGEEPEHPAPVLTLTAPADAEPDDDAADDDDDAEPEDDGGEVAVAAEPVADDDEGTDAIAVAALVIGVLAALLAGGALVTARRRPS